ncbi:RNA-directed DNA polymerase, eukaryota, reverse transcriptase zinc-binding domain protein, partial [Tanacetum coccineum]
VLDEEIVDAEVIECVVIGVLLMEKNIDETRHVTIRHKLNVRHCHSDIPHAIDQLVKSNIVLIDVFTWKHLELLKFIVQLRFSVFFDKKNGKFDRKTFVEATVQNMMECDKTLECIPTKIYENGVEVIMFDDSMVAEGSKRWDLTLYGFFVGHRMSVNELRKPLVVQKWSVDLNLDNTKLDKIPLWVKLCNVPLEAWTVKGISALASRVGKPLVMDYVTANKCKQGIGIARKSVKVEYDWKPPMYSECEAFGHTYSRCYQNVANISTNAEHVKESVKEKINVANTEHVKENVQTNVHKENNGIQKESNDEGFVEVKRRKNIGIDNKNAKEDKSATKTPSKIDEKNVGKDGKEENGSMGSSNKKWFVHRDILDDTKSIDMIAYYKQKSDLLVDKGVNIKVESNEEFEDILEEISGTWNIRGLSSFEKQDEVMKLMQEEKLQICVVFETHLKSKKIGKVCDIIFGRWKWFTNMSYCNKGCRIMVGWNDDVINIGVVHMARQSVLVKVETRDGNMKMYGTFIYTSNSGLERKELWKDLEIYKRIVGNEPWFLSGNLNVTLTPKEHSMGSSTMSCDMKDFQRCVNIIEVEDVNSSGLFYTWTKNLDKINKGGQARILKKLDRVMGNEDFINRFRGIEEGCRMFKTVKSLKGLKKYLKQLAWRNGNIFENVNKLRDFVKEIQKNIVKDPNNHELRCEEAEVLKLYSEAMKDEKKILFQKAKIKW